MDTTLSDTPTIAPVISPTITEDTAISPERIDTDGGDHDRFAHYAKAADVSRAYVTGEAIVALCGKKWVPSRDPTRYPVCPTCKERKEAGWTIP
jgi:hypothetical protein